jgi:hypothetical protein
MSQLGEVQQAKSTHKRALFARPNVVGLGVGYKTTGGKPTDQLSVVVMVREKIPVSGLRTEEIIPQDLDDIPTDVFAVGDLRPLQIRTDRWRPAPGGVSLGHYKITAGTFGCVVHDRDSGRRLILSNNHVLANRNDAKAGDPILQPGPADGGKLGSDMIALLERFHPIRFNAAPATCNIAESYVKLGNLMAKMMKSSHQIQAFQSNPTATNLVDAAVARPVEDSVILDENLEIGEIEGTTQPELDMMVRKSGRSTAFTTGVINILDATVQVNYGPERAATFEKQIITSPMSIGGDSGSLLVALDSPKAVGLLFAGSDLASIHNPIQPVLDQLRLSFENPIPQAKFDHRVAVERAQAVKATYQDVLMSKPNVVGVGVGLVHAGGKRTNQVGLIVMVSRKMPNHILLPEDRIPSEIEGVRIDVKEVGEIGV